MICCRCTSLASTLPGARFPRQLPLSFHDSAAAVAREWFGNISCCGPWQQLWSSFQSPNSVTSARLDFARGREGGFETLVNQIAFPGTASRERSRIVAEFGILKDAEATHSRVRRAFKSESGVEADEMQETSSTPEVSGSEEYLIGGKYCVLLTGHASDYSQKLYGGYGRMFIKLLGDPGDTWDVYPVVDGQFPAEEELEKYDGFVVTGSRHDAHGSEDWIAKLCALLQSLHNKKQNTLGVCFGHQVLSRALGGKTGKANIGWEIGLRKVQATDALATKPYSLGVPPTFKVLEVHQDQVLEIPPGGELLGFSDRTAVEIFAVGDHALGIQGHPEFTDDVVTDIIDNRLATGILKDEEANAARATLKAGQPDRNALLRLCKGFLKRKT